MRPVVIRAFFSGLRNVFPLPGSHGLSVADPVLERLQTARTDDERDAAIEALIGAVADPVISKVLSAKLRREPHSRAAWDDLRGEVMVRLIARLTRSQQELDAGDIASFRDYVAVVVCHVVDDHLRRSFPYQASVRNRVRYVLSHDERFALWRENGELVGGLRAWEGTRGAADVAEVASAPLHDTSGDGLRRGLQRLFAANGRPLPLAAIVTALLGTRADTDAAEELETLASPHADPLERMRNVQYVKDLWQEILLLPPRQRMALLLNLRDVDGESVARLFPAVGVAGPADIAAALEMKPAELRALWNDIPIEDARIAELLGITRQQVINLRKSARERLIRRLSWS